MRLKEEAIDAVKILHWWETEKQTKNKMLSETLCLGLVWLFTLLFSARSYTSNIRPSEEVSKPHFTDRVEVCPCRNEFCSVLFETRVF